MIWLRFKEIYIYIYASLSYIISYLYDIIVFLYDFRYLY